MHFQAWTASCPALLAAVLLTIASADLVGAEPESSPPDSAELSPAAATPDRNDDSGAATPSQAIIPIPLVPPGTDPPEAAFAFGPGPDLFGDWSHFRVVDDPGTKVGSPEPDAEAVATAKPDSIEGEPDATDPILADATSELVEVETQLAARRAELKRHEAELEKKEREISLRQAKISSSTSELAVIQEQLAKKRAELALVEASMAEAAAKPSAAGADESPEASAARARAAVGDGTGGARDGTPQSASEGDAGASDQAGLPGPDTPIGLAPATPADLSAPETAAASRAAAEPSPDPETSSSLHRLVTGLPSPLRRAAEGLADLIPGSPNEQLAQLLAVVLVVLLIAVRSFRRRGDLAVFIEYPDELRGTFRVRIATSTDRFKRNPETTRDEVLKGGTSTASEHHLVRRETSFRSLPCRRYFLTVDGLLQDPDTGEILVDCYQRRTVRVQPRHTERAEFDFYPVKCPVDVLVSWDSQPARDAAIAVRGSHRSLRSRREGPVRLELSKGTHTLVVGCGDRVLEREVEVQSFQPTRVDINIAGTEKVIFKGCPPAIRPYLEGNVEEAAEALERDGQSEQAHLLLARFELERGATAAAADHFEAAGHGVDAAELHASLSDFLRAAELFERAGDLESSAEMYQLAGEWLLAGEAFEAARDWENAVVCFREAGVVSRWIDALERQGLGFEAARIALDNGESNRGIGLLQRVSPEDPNYPEACSLLTDAFEREGHYDLAIQKIDDHLAASSTARLSGKLHGRLADLLEQTGGFERALDVLEDLRRLQPTYSNIASRIEALRKRRSNKQPTPISDGSGGAGTPTVFLDQRRYEILEEIGRGGMGVVFKAHDRRLGRMVALKRLPENLRRDHPKAVELFLREARSTASLNHPNIVTVYDTDQEDECFFITMELLKGRPLHRILRERNRLAATEVARLAVQVAAGLHYAHQVGVIHRDIKTSNLFLTEDGVIKIMDFGLAKMLEELRSASSVVGTPFYMAPEQAQGKPVDHRADLYALGVTLFELLTGEIPFPDVTISRTESSIDDLRHKLADVPDPLADLVFRLLAEDPDSRCGSATEVLAILDQVLSGD
jgi:tRNA A-37 threonylcarbamoyl transferase component Bud32